MDLYHLRVFQAAARTGSFTAAGRDLLLSQSTVSLHIKQLEEEFGCALFVRTKKRVYLSDAGRVLQQYVERTLAEVKMQNWPSVNIPPPSAVRSALALEPRRSFISSPGSSPTIAANTRSSRSWWLQELPRFCCRAS